MNTEKKPLGQSETHDMTQGPYYDHPLCRAIRKAVIGLSEEDDKPNWGNAVRSFRPHCADDPSVSPSEALFKNFFYGKNLPAGTYMAKIMNWLGRDERGAGRLILFVNKETVQ